MSSEDKRRAIIIGASITGAVIVGGGLFCYYYNYYKKDMNCKESCCGCDTKQQTKFGDDNQEEIKKIVNERYSATATQFNSKQQKSANEMSKIFGYTEEELKEFGSDSNMGLGCGNPIAQASIKKGEVVMDLGSGGGFDSFLALRKVGNTGKVIGIDASKDMINRATNNAKKKGYKIGSINELVNDGNNNCNISFYNTEIENMKSVPDNFVNCIISNCVLNLIPNKLNALKEIYRVLKPNGEGRFAVSDIALKKELPNDLNSNVRAYIAGYVNCISGAVLRDKFENLMKQAGFKNIKFILKNVDLNVWKSGWESGGVSGGCCGVKEEEKTNDNNVSCCADGDNNNDSCCPDTTDSNSPKPAIEFTKEQKDNISRMLKDVDLNEYIGSYYILATK